MTPADGFEAAIAPIPQDLLDAIAHLYPETRLTADGRYVLVTDLIAEIARLRSLHAAARGGVMDEYTKAAVALSELDWQEDRAIERQDGNEIDRVGTLRLKARDRFAAARAVKLMQARAALPAFDEDGL